jgi:hypothetical protein
MNVPRYRVWAPSQSPVRIEYPSEVLHEAGRHESGLLYGVRDGANVRVVAARRDPDARLSKFDLLGIFASRARGEVFLTEADLEHLEQTGGSIALVLAGINAGFFVHEPGGAIQTIKSYQEFCILDRPPPKLDRRKVWISLACFAALAFPFVTRAFSRTPPLDLSVREEASQLRISWNPQSFPAARLEITDGAERSWIPVTHNLSSATYVPLTGDVLIRLTAGARSENAHFIGIETGIEPAPVVDPLKQLKSEAETLRAKLAERSQRIAQLQAAVQATLAKLN